MFDIVAVTWADVVRFNMFGINVNFRCGSAGQYASPWQIPCWSNKPFIRYGNFSIFRPTDILDFLNFKILTAGPIRRPNMRQLVKCCTDWSNGHEVMAIFRFLSRPNKVGLKYVYTDVRPQNVFRFQLNLECKQRSMSDARRYAVWFESR